MSEGEVDRTELAREVIVSAGNVLRAAGFSRGEIADFFAQAAAMLAGGEAGAGVAETPGERLARIFADSAITAELRRIGSEAVGLGSLGERAVLKQAFDLAMRMGPLLGEAQRGMRVLAEETGMPLVATRAEAGGGAICVEEFEESYAEALAALAAVIEELGAQGDAEALAYLLGHLADNGVALGPALRDAATRHGAWRRPGFVEGNGGFSDVGSQQDQGLSA